MRSLAAVAAGCIALAMLAGCSSTPERGDLTKVTVGVMPIVDTSPIWLGVEEGFFEEQGLDVTLEIAQGGAAIVPSVVSGNYEFGFSNMVSLFVASEKGLPLTMLTPGSTTSGDTARDYGGVLTVADDIEVPADLAGKTVAVNTLQNIGDATISEIVERDGGDAGAIKFVEMGFPDMPAALSGGQVDAIWVMEPFLSIALGQGARAVTYNYAEVDPALPISAYFTTKQYAQSEPEIVERFVAGMTKSLDYAAAHPDKLREIMAAYTEIDPALREQLVLPAFPSQFNDDAIQALADLALKHGLLTGPLDILEITR